MIKCKILWVRDFSVEYDSYKYMVVDASDWDEVTEEEYKLLTRYVGKLHSYRSGEYPRVIRQDSIPVDERVRQVREFLEKEKEQEIKLREEKEAKRIQREIKQKAKAFEDKKKMLEQLKKELGEAE